MKKIVLLLIMAFAINSCDISDDQPNSHLEVVPVESYTLPESFTHDQSYTIKLKYLRPTECHYYEGIYYSKYLNTRTIGIQMGVLDDKDCKPLTGDPIETSFNFIVTSSVGSTYKFKFYKGEDTSGNDIFDEVEIPVTN